MEFAVNPNQWGVKAGQDDGDLCMDVRAISILNFLI